MEIVKVIKIYKIYWRGEISYAHKLKLDYPSKCQNLHGHNGLIEIWIKCKELNENFMILDFTEIKKIVMQYDHCYLNEKEGLKQPTSERLARKIWQKLKERDPSLDIKVRCWEDKDSYAEYED